MSHLTSGLEAWLTGGPERGLYAAGQWRSSRQVAQDVIDIRKWLTATHIQPGDRVVLGYPNSYAFVVTYFALLQHGAVVAPINAGMQPSELFTFLARCEPAAAFLTLPHWMALGQGDGNQSGTLRAVFCNDGSGHLPAEAYSKENTVWRTAEFDTTAEMAVYTPSEEDLAVLLYTSGTTGRPKAVGLKHRHVYKTVQNVIVSHQLTNDDVTYCFLPLFHINAQVVALLSTCLSGGKIVVDEKFSARKFWPTIAEHGVTWVSAVPTVLAILLNREDANAANPSRLRFVRSASAQLPAKHELAFESKFGVPIVQSYGMTEAASQICVNPIEKDQKRVGSVGLPFGIDLQVVNDDHEPLPSGQIGEIAIRGENVITSYVQADNQNDFDRGWFHTGDLGYVDEDGFVYLVGRKKEMINRAGEKISPYEVEDVIREHPLVDKVAVIGVPDDLYGEHVAAYIITSIEPEREKELMAEVLTICKTKLSSFKVPTDIIVVSDIPVGPTGKIQRAKLRQKVLAQS